MDNHRALYDILGVPFGADIEELKDAYRRLVKQYHPDLTHTMKSGHAFATIVHAYKTLKAHTVRKSIIDFPVKETKRRHTGTTSSRSHDIFTLGKLLCEGKTVGMRVFAARGLGNSGKRSAYAFLRKALADPSPVVVKTTVEAIGKLEIHQSAGELGAVFSRGDKEIKCCVLDAVERIGCKPNFHSIIFAGLKDQDHDIRKRSLKLYSYARHEANRAAL